MKSLLSLLMLLLTNIILAQEETTPKTNPFKDCKVEDKCFNERFKEWFSSEGADIGKYKGQKAIIELLVNEKGETEAIMSMHGDTEKLTKALSKALANFPIIEPALDENGKPYSLFLNITVNF